MLEIYNRGLKGLPFFVCADMNCFVVGIFSFFLSEDYAITKLRNNLAREISIWSGDRGKK